MKTPTIFLPDPSELQLEAVQIEENVPQVIITMMTAQPAAKCPVCHEIMQRVHSHYWRTIGDLPWAGIPVALHLQVRRFFCRNPLCKRKIFTERIPTVVAPWGRRTIRLTDAQQAIGLVSGGTGGANLCKILAMPISIDTVLCQMRQLNRAVTSTPRVLGVDDWAQRKGHTYGTILVDLERNEVIDLLPDRTAETLAQWLCEHPGVEIISRDRAEAYAEGARNGAPSATQVADRWHLLKNLAEALLKVLEQHHPLIERTLRNLQTEATTTLSSAVVETPSAQEAMVSTPETTDDCPVVQPTAADKRRAQRIEQAQQLYQRGWSQRAIAAHLNLDSKTVRRYLRLTMPLSPQRRGRRSLLDPFKPYLLERWQAGCHNAAQLFRELQSQNFQGRSTIVRHYVKELRQRSGLPPRTRHSQGVAVTPAQRPSTLRTLLWYILRKPESLSDDEQLIVNQLIAAHPKLAVTISLAQDFAAMVRQRQVEQLPTWLHRAEQSGSKTFQTFARSLLRDYGAIYAALSLPWSNGPTEGHVNRLKCLKRQMYGRAKFDLLRLRLLAG